MARSGRKKKAAKPKGREIIADGLPPRIPKEFVGHGRAVAREGSQIGAARLSELAKQLANPGGYRAAAEDWLRIRDRSGSTNKLVANEVQQKFDSWYGMKNIVLKARQMGITTWVSARFFLDVIAGKGVLAVQVAHDRQAAEQIFRIVHRFYQNLPGDIREGKLRTSRVNARQLVFADIDCEYRVESAADLDAGRGLTIQRLHCSEVGRWRKAEETLASLRAAVAPGGQVVLESTPQGTWGAFYREWQTAADSGFVRHFFPWWMEPSYRKEVNEPLGLSAEERELMGTHQLTMEQIAYRRELKATYKLHTRQEYAEDAETCFLASGDCVFDLDRLDERVAQCTHYDEREKLWEFLPALPGKKYIIGVDACGGGSEGDYACAQMIDENGVQVAELLARLTPEELAREVGRLAWRYNDAFIVVERNSHGLEVLAHLRNAKAQLYVDQKGKQGFETNLKTRPLLVAGLVELVAEHSELLQSRRLLRQMRSFVRNRGGKAEAAPGEHDDAVMAMGIAQCVRVNDFSPRRP